MASNNIKLIPKEVLLNKIREMMSSKFLNKMFPSKEDRIAYLTLMSIENFVETLEFEIEEKDVRAELRKYVFDTYDDEYANKILEDKAKLDSSDLLGAMWHGYEIGLASVKG